ncbi:phosphatase [Photobacterium rosenbergii]|uniref:Phosphatase n=1 Tax=Photobacterium rosenbergii TaxID=294936 RepID=A0ABU3ZID6_9GAMM|nr:phosphatase [Photobacterium rosenbergii]MDV5169889.1 phosphatase [Photobacterium rosenbergii]
MKFVVDTHSHTVSSGHAYSTVLENAAAAAQKGLQLLCVTDHASSMPGAPHYWHFANQKVLPRFLHGVGVLRGVEANIMNTDGEIDILPKVEDNLDWILASFHEPVFAPSSREAHTQALLNVIRSGRVDALGHLGNPNFDFDFERVLVAAAEANVLIEINNSSLSGSRVGSQPRCERIAEIGKEVGVMFTTGSDAHFAYDVGKFDSALALFDKVKVDESSIVTTSASRFLAFLHRRGRSPIAEFQSLR